MRLGAAVQKRKQVDFGRGWELRRTESKQGNLGRTDAKESCIDVDIPRRWLRRRVFFFDRRQLREDVDRDGPATDEFGNGDEGDLYGVRALRFVVSFESQGAAESAC